MSIRLLYPALSQRQRLPQTFQPTSKLLFERFCTAPVLVLIYSCRTHNVGATQTHSFLKVSPLQSIQSFTRSDYLFSLARPRVDGQEPSPKPHPTMTSKTSTQHFYHAVATQHLYHRQTRIKIERPSTTMDPRSSVRRQKSLSRRDPSMRSSL